MFIGKREKTIHLSWISLRFKQLSIKHPEFVIKAVRLLFMTLLVLLFTGKTLGEYGEQLRKV